jgi:glutamine amidotransferase
MFKETNCHPFVFGPFLFQHNGMLALFRTIRLPLLNLLSNPNLLQIQGTTDSEHMAALYFTILGFDPSSPATSWRDYSLEEMGEAMKKTIKTLDDLVKKHGGYGDSHSSLNLAVTDGKKVVCSRWRGGQGDEPPSLYWSTEGIVII